ncbi:hypothetical protein [Actinomycetospora flava]|uniref:Uncharacterized protein n=1 Tax=Actinomycetospora flava TaxID=3129232 RepID=A0ABU8M8R1_9PSEU
MEPDHGEPADRFATLQRAQAVLARAEATRERALEQQLQAMLIRRRGEYPRLEEATLAKLRSLLG